MMTETNKNRLNPYNGITLEAPKGPVMQTHGIVMDLIQGRDSTQNMDWTDYMRKLPFRTLEKEFSDTYDAVCNIFSLLKMDYQICNGGIEQYFYNYYHENREPYNENDTHHRDIDVQKKAMLDLAAFGKVIYPDKIEENRKFYEAAVAFQKCYLEENVDQYETIYSDEDEYIFDEDTNEYVNNPDYDAPYEAWVGTEDIVHDEEMFDEKHTDISAYMEELLELNAQYVVKDFVRELEKDTEKHNDLLQELKKHLPASAFHNEPGKEQNELSAMIQDAEDRTDVQSSDKQEHRFTPER